ncbi:TraR/DksA family transcriptional regulator [Marinobacter halophilus]|uniref:Molecular chaperone DnaK n=1 Tax=Marinobacter halophilus TaxID=1323740 RepID=A0A2T1KFF9_9GAMM|nr:TraR/DksA family transcriptional regulator [Marinobacter halophilus]PSF08864.1 molecular chaperone DnaK [Marinobacter halophilus]GGC64627.1 molecular chaperone DnaK [Marinobacter halophilus]
MTAEELEKFRNLLLKWREDLQSTSAERDQSSGTVHLDQQSVGRLSRMDALQGQALAKAGKVRAERQLKMIEAALTRIDNDDYGDCMECGEPINPKRLEIDPTSRHCITCAR